MKCTSFIKVLALACIATISFPTASSANAGIVSPSILLVASDEQAMHHAGYQTIGTMNIDSLSNISTVNYRVLQEEFTSEEILALNEMATANDIDQLVAMIESVRAVASPRATFTSRPTLEAFASWQPNGCTASPDSIGRANFRPACNNHDACYASFSPVSRADCDLFFHSQLYTECNRVYTGIKRTTCHRIADTYYNFVRVFGGKFYKGTGPR